MKNLVRQARSYLHTFASAPTRAFITPFRARLRVLSAATQEAELASRLVAFLRHVKTREHNEVQLEVVRWLRREGLVSRTEFPTPYANRSGRLDFMGEGRGLRVVGEVDRTWVREKSILKCQAHPHALKVFILRDCRKPEKARQRVHHLPRHVVYDLVRDRVISTDLPLQLLPTPRGPRPTSVPSRPLAAPPRRPWLSRLRDFLLRWTR